MEPRSRSDKFDCGASETGIKQKEQSNAPQNLLYMEYDGQSHIQFEAAGCPPFACTPQYVVDRLVPELKKKFSLLSEISKI